MITHAKLLDQHGQPLQRSRPRRALVEAFASAQNARQRQRRELRGTYDAARDSTEFQNYWANADHYDADSANSRSVREKLVPRSRYEVGNNGYADGIAQTYATDLVGVGPKLRMQTGSTGFNQLVEAEWDRWCKAVHFRRKLWCQAHAKHQDGEGFGVARRNPGVRHPIKLDYCLYETEQVQTPMLPFTLAGYIDGIKFDQFGNPESYDILKQHPGGTGWMSYLDMSPEQVPARFVMHWFMLRRPGQHRGIPESTSTLNTGAAARRWREATIAAAETAADFAVLLKSNNPPNEDEDRDAAIPMDSMPVEKRMMVTLPNSVEPSQLKAEHPGATYEAFHKSLVNEQARPKSMPYNKAACDSSSYNYASGRLDHQTYYGALDVDREDGNDLVLDPLFDIWFDYAILTFGWLGGVPEAIGPAARSHLWDWPKHRVADVESESNSIDTDLRNGRKSLSRVYSDQGEDYEDEIVKAAADFGITPDELRKIRLYELYPQGAMAVLSPAMAQQQNGGGNGAPTNDEE